MFADLIDGPLAHLPARHFGANSAWVLCAAIAHNLLHTAAILAAGAHARARGATLRPQLITVPARLARPARHPSSTYPPAGPGRQHGYDCGTTSGTAHQPLPDPHPADTPTRVLHPWKSWKDQRPQRDSAPPDMIIQKSRSLPKLFRGSRLRPPFGP